MTHDSQGSHPDLRARNESVDALCSRFERAWLAGKRETIEDCLAASAPSDRIQLLEELLQVELELRRKAGQKPHESEFLRRFPEDGSVIGRVFEQTAQHHESSDRQSDGAGLHVRCPHCRDPLELVPDAELESLNCPSCGSDFSLIDNGADTRLAREVSHVGHFKLVERVGIGAFGTVWKALDTELDRTVAVKVPRHGQLSEEQQEIFLREARAAAQLQHPNIVPVFEVGREGAILYIVSEFVRGITLSDWLDGQKRSVHEVLEVCVKLAAALHHAHEHGVIHRDLKPGTRRNRLLRASAKSSSAS